MKGVDVEKCPFCGGTAFLTVSYSEQRQRYYVYVACDVCGCKTKAYIAETDPEYDENSPACIAAITTWNKRTTNCGDECMLFKHAQCPHYDP